MPLSSFSGSELKIYIGSQQLVVPLKEL